MSRDALIVGINHYAKFGNLNAPATDAEAIAHGKPQIAQRTSVS